MSTVWTSDHVARVCEALAAPEPAGPGARGDHYERLALLSSFRLDEGELDDAAADALREDSVPLPADESRRMLKDSVRRQMLRELATRDALRRALLGTRSRPDDDLQRAIEAALEDRLPPLEGQTPEQLVAILQVVDWFAETEVRESLPPASRLRLLLERESLLGPLRELGDAHFRGRASELAALRAYVDQKDGDGGKRLPLLVFGPGGMGKSTLVARFILDSVDRLPLAYLDCDRPGIVAMEPVTLLAEIVRQLALQFPGLESAATHLRDRWLARLAADSEAGPSGQASVTIGRDTVMKELKLFLDILLVEDRRLLLVIDTFEEVQYRSRAYVDEIFDFLGQLQELLPGLRTVIAGRNSVPNLPYVPLEIGALDLESARAILTSLGVAPEEAVEALGLNLGGNPLNLRLAAELWCGTAGAGLDDIAAIADEVDLQGTLYGRILGHLHDDDVRDIAHPGLILRRITADVIHKVLAGPCGLGPIDSARARQLFDLLRDEMSLVVPEEDNAVRHRKDVRRIMLRALRRDQPETTRQIEEAAILYYSGFDDATSRAEEIYHRLSLNQPAETIEERWIPGIEESLRSAVDELEGESRAFLAARLGIELYDVDLDKVDQATWELVAARQAADLLELDKPLEALAVLRRRSARSPGSHLHWLHAQALRRSGHLIEAREVARIGIADMIDDPSWGIVDETDEARLIGQSLMDWYCDPEGGEPTPFGFARQQKWLLGQQMLRRLAGPYFAGRRAEMAALDFYVVNPSTASPVDRPPLFIQGAGGSGKSALVANYILEQDKRLPFVWIGAEALGSAGKGLTPLRFQIASEIARQLADQFPRDGLQQVAAHPLLNASLSSADLPDALERVVDLLRFALGDAEVLASGEKPLLIVIDDVDQIHATDGPAVAGLLDLLFSLHGSVPRLRIVFLGRSVPADLRFELLTVGALDAQSAESILLREQVENEEVRSTILRLSSGNPYALRLMLDLYRDTGQVLTPESEVASLLLARVASHVQDPDVARILPAALIVRRISPEILREVIGPVCGLALDREAAEALFEKLAREAWLVLRDGDLLAPRPDVRRALLDPLREDWPQMARAIDLAAIAFYEKGEAVADRAEEIYHRLATSADLSIVERRWREGVEPWLDQAADDFHGSARIYLYEKLGRDLDELDWLEADQGAWEDYVAARAGDLWRTGRLEEALELLRKRSARQPRSGLFALEARVLIGLHRAREALAVVQDGLAGMPNDSDLMALGELSRKRLGIEESSTPADQADPARQRLRALAKTIVREHDRAALIQALSETLPTNVEITSAWHAFDLLANVRMDGAPIQTLIRIVDYASRQGLLEDLLVAALAFAPVSPLVDLAEGRGAPTFGPLIPRRRSGFEDGPIFNRMLLRRFLADLGMRTSRRDILFVDGPPGSGKSATVRIAHLLAPDLGPNGMTSIHIRLDEMESANWFAQRLFDHFEWRWEQERIPVPEPGPASRMARRYAQMVLDRLSRLEGGGRNHLMIFEAEHSYPLPLDLLEMIDWMLEKPQGPAFIIIGVGGPLPRAENRGALVDFLQDFSVDDIWTGLHDFIRDHELDGDPALLTRKIVESVAGAEPYNAQVSRIARLLLRDLRDASERGLTPPAI